MRAVVRTGIAVAVVAGLVATRARAETNFSYGTGAGSYVPGGSTSYGVGSGAYAPGVGAAPRYGAPGSAGSGFRVPSAPGVPTTPGAAAAGTSTAGRPESSAAANPYAPSPIDTGVAPRRAPRGAPATGAGSFGTGPGLGPPGLVAPRDPFGR